MFIVTEYAALTSTFMHIILLVTDNSILWNSRREANGCRNYSTINLYESMGLGGDQTRDPGFAVRHVSAVRRVTNCAKRLGQSDVTTLVIIIIIIIISSHEPKAHGWANSIPVTPSFVRRPSVNIFKHLLLWNHWANWTQISYGDSLGHGNESLFKWSWSHDQDGRHAYIW